MIKQKQIQPAARTHTSQVLAINTARKPSLTRDVDVVITFNLACGDGDIATGIVEVDNSGGGTYQTIATVQNNFNVSGIGVGGSLTIKEVVKVRVPVGSNYRWNNTGTAGGTTTVTSIYELIL